MSDHLPARWRDDAGAPAELRELGEVLGTLDDPPPEGARARVWAALQRPARRRWAPWLAWAGGAAALVVAAALGAPRLSAPTEVAEVRELLGTLTHDGTRARVGQAIHAGAVLSTAEGRAVIRLGSDGLVYLSANTTAAVAAPERVVLGRGTVVTKVRAGGDRGTFTVVAGDTLVRVVGTVFQVSRQGEHVAVTVHRGRVRVSGPGHRTVLGAGDSFSSRGAAPPLASEALELLGAVALDPRPEPATTVARPEVQRPAATEPALARAPRRPAPDPRAAEPAADSSVPAACGVQAELETYRAAEAARARDLHEAVRQFEALLSACPNGTLAQEARIGALESALQLGERDKAKFHIDLFLAAYPNSERAAEVHFLRAEIARQNHDCAAAIPDYDAALTSHRRVADAMYFKAFCLLTHDQPAAALPLLERYLERFPTGRHAAEARARVIELRALDHE